MNTVTSFVNRLKAGSIGAAAIVVAVGILISRLLGIVREIIFAAMLGSNAVTDQYVAAFRIPDYANYLLAGGFLTITFIPIFAKYIANDEEDEAWLGFTSILRWLAIGITIVIAVAWVLTPGIVEALYPDFTADQMVNTANLTRVILPAQFAFVVGAMFVAVQYAKGVFTIPTLAPIVYNVGIIGGGVGWALATGEADPSGFIWGALVGAFAGNLLLQIWGASRVGMKINLRATWRHPAVRAYFLLALPLMIGQSIVALDEVFMSVFGAMVGEGAQTDLQYARRTMFVPIGVIAQAAAVATYPTLARLFAEGNRPALLRTVDRSLKYVIALSIGAAGLVAAMSLPTVRVLFERYAFTADDTAAVSSVLFVYAFAIPIWGTLQIITRAFYAKREMWTPVIVGTAATILAVPGYFVMQNAFGLQGVALASVLTLGAYTAVLLGIWYWPNDTRAGMMDVVRTAGRTIPLAIPASLVAGGVSWAIATGISGATWLAALISLVVGAGIYVTVALGIGATLNDWLWHRP
jgi:putative peptidoglycan lipid II flippase